ncbi:MAG: hypothetical protein H0U70_05560 [Tatlockia sp.]|nr:hypothetical protein [Tatlockia sp.]
MNLISHKKIIPLVLTLFAPPIHPSTWPIFFYPDKQLIMDLNIFDNTDCPAGEIKLKPRDINVNNFTCDNACPEAWVWKAKIDDQCHSFSDFDFKRYQINHYRDYDEVIAFYGARSSGETYFSYEMKTLPGTYWYCTQYKQGLDYITCANDTFRLYK